MSVAAETYCIGVQRVLECRRFVGPASLFLYAHIGLMHTMARLE